MMRIYDRDRRVLYEGEAASLKDLLEQALRDHVSLARADLAWAVIGYANLQNVDLTGASLVGAHLAMADLENATLSCADLECCVLSGANLAWADLSGARLASAHLVGANLSGAHLAGVSLVGANLRGATLVEADLQRANLSGVDLSGADLKGAFLEYTNLVGTNLDGARISSIGGEDLLLVGERPVLSIGPIGPDHATIMLFRTNRGEWIESGDWSGFLPEFVERLNEMSHSEEYLAVVHLAERHARVWKEDVG